MLIFPDLKLVYLACPKTGTTTFERTFGPYADSELSESVVKHVRYARFRRKFPAIAKKYEVVTCLRDPLESLYSWYSYRSRLTLMGRTRSTRGMSFEEFFDEWCKPEPAPFAKVAPSVKFVTDKNGMQFKKLKVVRYEDADLLFAHIATRLGISPRFDRYNRSPSPEGTLSQWVGRMFRGRADKADGESRKLNTRDLTQRVDLSKPKIQEAYDIYHRIEFTDVGSLKGARAAAVKKG